MENLKGNDVCEECPKRMDKRGPCTVYPDNGMAFRSRAGYCPVVNKYADWRTDKPVQASKKVHAGQGKTKQGGNR